jgi:hypothetical protein
MRTALVLHLIELTQQPAQNFIERPHKRLGWKVALDER